MNGRALYIEIDEYCRTWLRNLIAADLICPGDVVGDILDVRPRDLDRYNQVHAFAGIGIWSGSLRDAGVRDTDHVWTGSCPCFPAGVLIMTKNGYVPIEAVKVGDRVLTHRARWKAVTHVGSEEADCITLKGQGHFGLTCTPEHPFLSEDNEWTAARKMSCRRWATIASVPPASIPELKPQHQGYFFDKSANGYRVKGFKEGRGVYVGLYKTSNEAAAARKSAIATGVIDVRGAEAADPTSLGFARFLGYWLGDGWVTGNSVIICGARQHGSLLSEILDGARLPCSLSMERTSSRARCGSKALAKWITEQFGSGAEGKKIPGWLHGMPDDYRAAFLAGYAEADGHTEDTPHGDRVQRFTTISRAIAIGVRVLLNQAGISASVTRHDPRRENVIEGRKVSEQPFFRVTAYGATRSFRFTELHGWGLVRSIKPAARCRVYNLAVKDDESYTADGIVVHNCQPFSAAGQRKGFEDERHLWPAWFRLIRACRPPLIFGEQVSSPDGLGWLSGPDASLSRLRGREDLRQILRELQGSAPANMQVVRDGAGAGAQTPKQRMREQITQGLARKEARLRVSEYGALQSATERHFVRPGPAGHSGSHRSGDMRSNWSPLQSGGRENVGQSLFGPNQSWRGIHEGQRAGGSLLPERHGEHLGRAEGSRYFEGDFGSAKEAERWLAAALNGSVEEADARAQYASVQADLEGAGYAIGAADLCAAGIAVAAGETEVGQPTLEWIRGAVQSCPDPFLAAELRDYAEWFDREAGVGPAHIRQRLCWMAHADEGQRGGVADREGREPDGAAARWQQGDGEFESGRTVERLANSDGRYTSAERQQRGWQHGQQSQDGVAGAWSDPDIVVGNSHDEGSQGRSERWNGADQRTARPTSLAGWTRSDWIICTDGKARPIEPGAFPLAHGQSNRVGRLRAYGNAMHRAKITQFILAAQEAIGAPS